MCNFAKTSEAKKKQSCIPPRSLTSHPLLPDPPPYPPNFNPARTPVRPATRGPASQVGQAGSTRLARFGRPSRPGPADLAGPVRPGRPVSALAWSPWPARSGRALHRPARLVRPARTWQPGPFEAGTARPSWSGFTLTFIHRPTAAPHLCRLQHIIYYLKAL